MIKAYRAYWYDYLDINNLLRDKSNDSKDYHFVEAASQDTLHTLQRVSEAFNVINASSNPTSAVVIPINLGNRVHREYKGSHWVALVIKRDLNGDLKAFYNDSLGTPMDDTIPHLRQILLNHSIASDKIKDFRTKQQFNSYDCGSWTVLNLDNLAKTGDLPEATEEDIIEQRRNAFGYINYEKPAAAVSATYAAAIEGTNLQKWSAIVSHYRESRVVPSLSLESALSLMEYFLNPPYIQRESLAVLAGTILHYYKKEFCDKYNAINWSTLSKFDLILNRNSIIYKNIKIYENIEPLIQYGVNHDEIKAELNNLKIFIETIRTNPTYKHKCSNAVQPMMPRLSRLTEFVLDGGALYSLGLEIEQGDIGGLHDYWEPQITGGISWCLPSEMDELRNYSKIVGRWHCILTLARLGEAINSLSDRVKSQFFSKEMIDGMKSARNLIFHPEKEDNWLVITQLTTNKGNLISSMQYFVNHKDDLLQGYALARNVYDFYARRNWKLDNIPCLNDTSNIKYNKLIEPFLKIQNDKEIYIQMLWNEITADISPVISSTSAIHNITKNFTQKSSCDFSAKDLQELELYLRTEVDEKHLKLVCTYFKAKYHMSLKGNIDSKDKICELLNMTSENKPIIYYSNNELKECKNFCDQMSDKPSIHDINKWVYAKRIALIEELRQNASQRTKQGESLRKYKEDYEKAKDNKDCDYQDRDQNIIEDYPKLMAKNSESLKKQKDIIKNFIFVDKAASEALRLYRVDKLIPLLPRLLECLQNIDDYSSKTKPLDPLMLVYNTAWSSITTVEFFTMVAGSLIRACIEDRTESDVNDPFINFTRQKISAKGPSTTLYAILKEFQSWRGEIAHIRKVEAGIPIKCDLLQQDKYSEYAKMILKPLEQLLDAFKAESKKPEIFRNPEKLYLKFINDSQIEVDELYVMMSYVLTFPDFNYNLLHEDVVVSGVAPNLG